jgi:folate-binding protein YgfZ
MPSKSDDSHLFSLSTISVSGPDAIAFLQSQLTADLGRLDSDRWTAAAWCNPKGRALVVMQVLRQEDAVILSMPEPLAGAIYDRLNMYRIGRKVTISAHADVPPGSTGHPDEAIIPQSAQEKRQWLSSEIDRGMPWLLPETADRFLPQMLGLERLGGLSFRKGCYPGQEIIARVHYPGPRDPPPGSFRAREPTGLLPGAALALTPGECTVLYAIDAGARGRRVDGVDGRALRSRRAEPVARNAGATVGSSGR